MKSKIVFLIILFLITNSSNIFPRENTIILDIRKKFNSINKNLLKFKKVRISLDKDDPATVYGYFKKNSLRKIEYHTGDNMHIRKIDYYFWHNNCFFVFDRTSATPAPSNSWKNSENRFYFHNRKLYRWINTSKNIVTLKGSNYKYQEKLILSMIEYLTKRVTSKFPD